MAAPDDVAQPRGNETVDWAPHLPSGCGLGRPDRPSSHAKQRPQKNHFGLVGRMVPRCRHREQRWATYDGKAAELVGQLEAERVQDNERGVETAARRLAGGTGSFTWKG